MYLGGFLCPFFKIEKKCPVFAKSTLFIFIYELNFSFKMLFLEYQGKWYPKFFSAERFFFLCFRFNVYQSDLVLRNLPCLEKFLVTRLLLQVSFISLSLSLSPSLSLSLYIYIYTYIYKYISIYIYTYIYIYSYFHSIQQ